MTDEAHWRQERASFAAQDAARAADRGGETPEGRHTVATEGEGGLRLLGAVFDDLARMLFADQNTGVAGVLARVVEAGRQVVPHAAVVSVTLRRGTDGFSTPLPTDGLAGELDDAQYEHGEGPCIDAALEGELGIVTSLDLADDPNWPHFGPAAARLGMASLCAVGLFPVGDPPLRGALNFYAPAPRAFKPGDQDTALLLAAHASAALGYVSAVEAAELCATQYDEALASRDVIGQAKGILMERRGCSADEAFDVLRRASQDLNIKLRTVAATLAERRDEL